MVTPNFPSLGHRLQHQLQQALPFEVPLSEIPLKPGRDGVPPRYRSAVALKFAKVQQFPSLALANCIANHWKTSEFEISVTPPGFLDVTVADSTLADWLQQLASDRPLWDVPQNPLSAATSAEVPFSVQYACYRCGSLLRLGEREGLVQLDGGDRIVDTLPWCNANGRFRCDRDSEHRLIASGIVAADILATEDFDDRQILKLAHRLADAFETFHRDCRIIGQPSAIARVRLGLLAVTRILLKWLLEAGLGVSAVAEM
ncbi:DALR anticodon-binding domain-containing protein [Baaleninema sp.]|uniref:DALR anticodon-binding domain-containing protein n=1 Tax=Baaleninema sp. TaxID=3101197 RepID=UPI003D017332